MTKFYCSIALLMFAMTLASCGQESTETKPKAEAPEPEMVKESVQEAAQTSLAAEQVEVVDPVTPPNSTIDKTDPAWKLKIEQPELMQFESGKNYYWDMETNKGPMSFKLFQDTAPMHVTSTIYLTNLGFYDNIIFHRIIPGFMAQGGDPTGTGRSGPAYKYDGEFDGGRHHDKPGLLSMANAGPGTDGSQFFITFTPTPHLDGKHTLFGELISGMDTLKALESSGSRSGRTSEKLEIIKATIRVE